MRPHELAGEAVQLGGGEARDHERLDLAEEVGDDAAAPPDRLDLAGRLQGDHAGTGLPATALERPATAWDRRAATPSDSPTASAIAR